MAACDRRLNSQVPSDHSCRLGGPAFSIVGDMDEPVAPWWQGALDAINLLSDAAVLLTSEAVLADTALLEQVGKHLIGLAEYVHAQMRDPADPVLLFHWERVIELYRTLGTEITKASTITFDLNPAGTIGHKIAAEVDALVDRVVDGDTDG
jgi:hypothetical protein